ncbi:MAG: hypothetical protein JNK09_06070 [Prolixibacteraceae bacterium]|nr:hypothetical protein [Prolixibacteraceae bacterium]
MTASQIIQFMQSPGKLNRETLPFLKEIIERYPAFEAGWFLYLKNLKNLNDSLFEQELLLGALRIQDRRKLYLFLNQKVEEVKQAEIVTTETSTNDDPDLFNLIFPTEYQLDAPSVPEVSPGEVARSIQENSGKKFSLIEKFLEAQPKMPPIKEGDGRAGENASQQEEEHEELVTETLASIYAQQGYYKKAIQIFEKLSLKYPEKSTYFAGHIEKIKNLMNN